MIGAFSGVDEKSEATLLLVIEPPSGSCNAVSNFGRIVFTRFARRSAFGAKVNDERRALVVFSSVSQISQIAFLDSRTPFFYSHQDISVAACGRPAITIF